MSANQQIGRCAMTRKDSASQTIKDAIIDRLHWLATSSLCSIDRSLAHAGAVPAVLLACLCSPAHAGLDASGLRYAVEITPVSDAVVDAAVERASLLAALADDEPVSAVALIARADADRFRIDDVLRSFGYYDAVIDMQIDGVALADAMLPEVLASGIGDRAVTVKVRIDTGPLYRLAVITIDDDPPGSAASAIDLRAGEPADAARVLAAGAAMLDALREDGYALATVPSPQAEVDHRTRTMDVTYRVETGPQVAIGTIELTGLERLRDAYVRRRLGLAMGDPYSPSRLEQARRDLLASDALIAARIIPATTTDADGRLPLRVAVVERKRRTIRLAGAYASDDGASLLLGWTHRNLLGRAERLSIRGEIGTIDGASRDNLDYAVDLSLRLPDRWRQDLDLALDLGAVRESLTAYDRDAVTIGGALERRLSPRLSVALGAAFERSRITQDGPAEDFRLLSLPMSLSWDSTDDALAPRRGLRLNAQLVPVPWVHGDGEPFTRARLTAAGYLDLARLRASDMPADAGAGPARSLIAARVAVARIIGAAASDVPPDWRLYAGGAGSVRGYPYQAIGPRTAGNAPAGGNLSLEASLELRRRIGGRWGLAAFVDVGSVTADGLPALGGAKVGVGVGIRFHTVIGALRADLAVPLEPYPGDAPAQLYLGIGEAF